MSKQSYLGTCYKCGGKIGKTDRSVKIGYPRQIRFCIVCTRDLLGDYVDTMEMD